MGLFSKKAPSGGAHMTKRPKAPKDGGDRRRAAASVRSLSYAQSPLLAAKTPPGRSKFIVALVGLGFCMLVGRAVYIQAIGTEFYLSEGEKRYAHTLELRASRGRILDRNGLLLATSVSVPSIWAIPRDVKATPDQRRELARLLEMPPSELDKKLDDGSRFAWLKRQVDDELWKKIRALKIEGVYEVNEYRRKYPEGEAAAHLVGFTNLEDVGQEGIELAFESELKGRNGSREVVKDRLGRVVEDMGQQVDAANGQDIQLSVDSKVQFFAYQRIRDAVAEHKAKAGSVVVLDAHTGEVLALANYPSYQPDKRQNLSGEQLRNRALTDTFEPGSTMKPITVGMALEAGRITPQTIIDTTPGRLTITGSTITDTHNYGVLTVEGVIQKSSNVGATKIAQRMSRNEPVGFDDYYMRVTPRFDAPGGPHAWMSRHVFVGVAEKIPGANRIHYFVVR